MRKLYGDTVRQDAGLTRMLKKLARANGRLLELSADKHAPELKRRALDLREALERAVGQTTDAVDQLLARCACLRFVSFWLGNILTYGHSSSCR
jgi:phosphatidylethanolamine N-methyltransferase